MSNETSQLEAEASSAEVAKAKKKSPPAVLRKVPTADVSGRSAKASMKIEALAKNLVSQRMNATSKPKSARPRPQPRSASYVKKPTVTTRRKPEKIKVKGQPSLIKWFCIGLSLLILVALVANYWLVHMPIASGISKSDFKQTTVYGHLGGFFQPNALIIKIIDPTGVKESEVTRFLATIAEASPESPVGGRFDVVMLGNGYFGGSYLLEGKKWEEFAKLKGSDIDRQNYLMENVVLLGEKLPLLRKASQRLPSQRVEYKARLWNEFIHSFLTAEEIKAAAAERAAADKEREQLRRQADGEDF